MRRLVEERKGKGGGRGRARCAAICQREKYKNHKVLGSQQGLDCLSALQQKMENQKKNSARAASHSAGGVEGCRILPQGFALRPPKLEVEGVSFAMTLA